MRLVGNFGTSASAPASASQCPESCHDRDRRARVATTGSNHWRRRRLERKATESCTLENAWLGHFLERRAICRHGEAELIR